MQTSLSLYDDLKNLKLNMQELVLEAAARYQKEQADWTDRELLSYLFKEGTLSREDPNLIRPRRNELCNENLVIFSCRRKCSITGRNATAWKVA